MIILGLDPGATTGWCSYDTDRRHVINRGTFRGADHTDQDYLAFAPRRIDVVVLERPVAHGPTRPQVVDCAWVAGQLVRDALRWCDRVEVLTRLEIRQTLTAATHGVVRVINDATAWAALKLLHGGDGCDRKPRRKKGVVVDEGGPLGGVTGHERAALACAVAWVLRQEGAE
jgi:hypothetical protein